jgi:hypothetical protein
MMRLLIVVALALSACGGEDCKLGAPVTCDCTITITDSGGVQYQGSGSYVVPTACDPAADIASGEAACLEAGYWYQPALACSCGGCR